MHVAEGDADDGDVEEEPEAEMGQTNPEAADEEPQHVHEEVQTACLLRLMLDMGAEGPEGEYAQLDGLQAEGDADDGDEQEQSAQKILDGNLYAAEEYPDDVSFCFLFF